MTLQPIKSKVRRRAITTYDLEWVPETGKLRCAGVYDERRGYRVYTTMTDFIDHECNTTNEGRIFYAHAGGLFDALYIADEIIRRGKDSGWSFSAAFSGSAAILMRVRYRNRVWTFADSYWLLRDSLRRIGDSLQLSKGGRDYQCPGGCDHEYGTCIFHAPLPVLIEYNQLDCVILWKAIKRFEDELIDLGGELRTTIASCAMRLFQRAHLGSDIHTNLIMNDKIRDSYIASRVEVFTRRGAGRYYDINSSFPHSMLAPLPGDLKRVGFREPDNDDPWFARAVVTVPDCVVPPLPYRCKKGLFHPVGTWESTFSGVDLRWLQECGGTIERVKAVWTYEGRDDLRSYATEIYELRKKEADPFRKLVLKYLLNSLYGKFAERREKEKLVLWPESTSCPHGGKHVVDGVSECMRMVTPGCWLVSETRAVRHEHVPIAAYITALSRIALGRLLRKAESEGVLYYCDTDSVMCTTELPTGTGLGELKLECEFENGVFLAPKLYAIDPVSQASQVRAKGFRRINRRDFDRLADECFAGVTLDEKEAIGFKRFLRLKELCASGNMTPRDASFKKRFALATLPKRRFLSDGTSVPWNVTDIADVG